MKFATALGLIGLTTAVAVPASSSDGVRTLPGGWEFTINQLRGPGCPDTGKVDSPTGRTTRLTYGSNTVDGSEIYYWFIAYPWMRVDLAEGHNHQWCEVTVGYKEYTDYANKVEAADYQLRLHKNGTQAIFTYDLEEGVTTYWDFYYKQADGTELTDTVELNGPVASGQYAQQFQSNNTGITEPVPLSKCGSGEFTFRTELFAFGKKGQKGIVASEKSDAGYYGGQGGFSYDWEKCA